MLTDEERLRFNELRDRRDRDESLTDAEVAEVDRLSERIVAAEAAYLRPATERLRRESAAAGGRLDDLRRLIVREEEFLARLQETVQELHREREFLDAERRRLTAGAA